MAKEITNEDLAMMIKEGFDKVDERFEKVENRLNVLEKGQEDIKMKLDNVVYRFEYNELVERIKVLEKKAGIKK